MKVQTFLGKVGVESLKQMDDHINDWLTAHPDVQPKHITQSFGTEKFHDTLHQEPVLITSVWY